MSKKPKAIVIGTFADASGKVWSPNAEAFDSVLDALDYLGNNKRVLEDLAYELNVPYGEILEKLETFDQDKAMTALVEVLQGVQDIAVKAFRNIHEANTFVALVEQLDEKRKKEQNRRRLTASQ